MQRLPNNQNIWCVWFNICHIVKAVAINENIYLNFFFVNEQINQNKQTKCGVVVIQEFGWISTNVLFTDWLLLTSNLSLVCFQPHQTIPMPGYDHFMKKHLYFIMLTIEPSSFHLRFVIMFIASWRFGVCRWHTRKSLTKMKIVPKLMN